MKIELVLIAVLLLFSGGSALGAPLRNHRYLLDNMGIV